MRHSWGLRAHISGHMQRIRSEPSIPKLPAESVAEMTVQATGGNAYDMFRSWLPQRSADSFYQPPRRRARKDTQKRSRLCKRRTHDYPTEAPLWVQCCADREMGQEHPDSSRG